MMKKNEYSEKNWLWIPGGCAGIAACLLLTGGGLQGEQGLRADAWEVGRVYASESRVAESAAGQKLQPGQILWRGTDLETESESESETENESESEMGSMTESESDSETESETESESESEMGSVIESESDSETETESESESEIKSVTESESDSETEMERVTESESETKTEFETERENMSETEIETELESGTRIEPESEYESESETSLQTEFASGFQPEPETETILVPEPMPEPATEPATGAVTGLPAEMVTERVTECPTELVTEPATEMVTEPVTEPATEPHAEPEPETPAVLIPEPIERGKQYEVHGDANAWYRDGMDRLWVRQGTDVYVETSGSSGYGSGGSVTDVQTDGVITFQLKKTAENGEVVQISELQQEPYYVDGEAPEAKIMVSGKNENGIIYAAQSAEVRFSVAPDGKSGLKKAAYCICGEGETPENASWTDCADSTQISVREEGAYRIYIRTEDQVGNLAFFSSDRLLVDCTPPEITVKGIQNQTANSGNVQIQVSCRDAHYRAGSLCIVLEGANSGRCPQVKEMEENEDGVSVTYFDFPKEQGYDDAYRLLITAEDLAGNRVEKQLEFSVNRFGSVYDLSSSTKQLLDRYYLTQPAEIVFLETNIDYVGESAIYCRENGEIRQLVRDRDYQVAMQGSSDSWKQYQYTISAACFEKEGVYELLLASKDQADNQSDTGIQGKRVTFALDWTAPDCLITGIEEQGVYQEEMVTACIRPRDNLGVCTVKLYCNSDLVKELDGKTGFEDPVKLELSAQEYWQTIEVYICDLAGNEYWSPEIPVYVGKTEKAPVPYERTRTSAQEKERQKKELEAQKEAFLCGAGGKDAAGMSVRYIKTLAENGEGDKNGFLLGSLQKTEAGDSEQMESGRDAALENSQGAIRGKGQRKEGKNIIPEAERARRGKLLMCFGVLLFAVTGVVCAIPVRKRKK